MKKAITLLAVSAVGLALSEEFADNNLIFDDFGDNYLAVTHKRPQQAQPVKTTTNHNNQPKIVNPPKPQPIQKQNPPRITQPIQRPTTTTTTNKPSQTTFKPSQTTYHPSQSTYKPSQTNPTKDRPHVHPDSGKPIQQKTPQTTHAHPYSTGPGKTVHNPPPRNTDGKPVIHNRPKDSEHHHPNDIKHNKPVVHKRPSDKSEHEHPGKHSEHEHPGHHDASKPSQNKKHTPPKGSAAYNATHGNHNHNQNHNHPRNGTHGGPGRHHLPGNHTRSGTGHNGKNNRTRSAGHHGPRGGRNITDPHHHPRSNRTISEGRRNINRTKPLTRAELKKELEMEKLREKMLEEGWKRQQQEMNRTINAKQDLINQLQKGNPVPGKGPNGGDDNKGPGAGPGTGPGNNKGDNTKPPGGPGGPGAADPNANSANDGKTPPPGPADTNAAGPGPINSGPAPGPGDNSTPPPTSNNPGFQMPQISLPDFSQLFPPKQQTTTTTQETKSMPNLPNPLAEGDSVQDEEGKPKEKPVPKKPVPKRPEPKKPEVKPKSGEKEEKPVKNNKPETYTLDELEGVFKHIKENPKTLSNNFDKTLSAWKEKNKGSKKKTADPDGDHYTKEELETFYNYMRFNKGSEKESFAKVWDKWDAWKTEQEKGIADNNLMHLGTLLKEAESFKKAPEEKKFLGKFIQ